MNEKFLVKVTNNVYDYISNNESNFRLTLFLKHILRCLDV